jgi:hypothetical protein
MAKEVLQENIDLANDKAELLSKNTALNDELNNIKSAVLTGNIQAAVYAVHRKQEVANQQLEQERNRINAERAEQRAIKEAGRLERDTERVLKEIPGLKPEYERKVAVAKNTAIENVKKLENFFALDKAGLQTLSQAKHSMYESPSRFIFTNHEYKEGNRTYTYYKCDVCLHEFSKLYLAEEHLHAGDDFDVHKNKAIEQIKREESEEIRQLSEKYNYEIAEAIRQMHIRDNNAAHEKRYAVQAREEEKIRQSVLVTDNIAQTASNQDLKPWPPRGKGMIFG